MAESGFQLHWQSVPASEEARPKKSSKIKFTCPDCGQNAWAKPDGLLICGECFDAVVEHVQEEAAKIIKISSQLKK